MRQQGMGLPLGLSIGLHLLIAAVLLTSIDFSDKPPAPPHSDGQVITAKAVDSKVVEQQVKRLKAEKAAEQQAEADRQRKLEQQRQNELKRIAELKRQRAQEEQQRQAAEKAAQQAKVQQQQEAQKARQLELQRQQKEAEAKKAEAAAKAAAEKQRKEEAAAKAAAEKRRKEEAERQRKAEEARRKKAAEAQLAKQMEAEAAARAKARQQQVLSELQKYQALINQTIKRNFIRDDSMRGKEAKLQITLAPSGLVLDVKYVSGDRAIFEAAQRAVWKAGTLPVSKDPQVFAQMRQVNITMKPDSQ